MVLESCRLELRETTDEAKAAEIPGVAARSTDPLAAIPLGNVVDVIGQRVACEGGVDKLAMIATGK
jgi:hypothetical protein